MDCATVNREELAEQYLQGKLDSARQDEFETHLLECAKCMQELELLQVVRQDLAERGHEIRGWTASKPFFRWQTVAFAALLVILIASSIAIRQRKQNNAIAVLPPPDTNRPPAQATGSESSTTALSKPPMSGGTQETTQDEKKTEVASATRPEKTDKLPSTGRDYLNFAKTTQGVHDATRLIGPPPNRGLKKGTEQAASAAANADGKGAQEDTSNSQPAPVRVAEEKPKPDLPPHDTHEKPELTTAQGVELARIGMVEAPAYTFSGLAFNEKPPKTDKRGAFSKDAGLKGPGRELFKDGMNKYVDGHYGEAAEYLKQAVQLEPQAVDINFYLGICDLLQGHPEESVAPLKNAAAVGQSIYLQPSHYYLAKAYVQGNKLADAEEEFRKATAAPGRLTSEAKALLARLQTLRGQIEKP